MKQFFPYSCLAIALGLLGCTKPATVPGGGAPSLPDSVGTGKKPQGIEVGNGLTASFTSDYKLKVSYHPELDRHEVSPSEFYIDNAAALSADQPRSEIRFHVYKDGNIERTHIANLRRLDRYLARRFPGVGFESVDIHGLRGRRHQLTSDDELHATYYLIASSGDLLEAHIDAYAACDGLKLIPPIVQTLRLDDTAPVLQEVEILNDRLSVDERLRLRFRATDDLSGVMPDLWLRIHRVDGSSAGDLKNVFARRLDRDWFLTEFPIQGLEPGRYLLDVIAIADRAGNRRMLHATLDGLSHGTYGASTGNPAIHLLRFTLRPKNEKDLVPPNLAGVSLDTPVTPAGERNALLFRATDNDAGIEPYRELWGEWAPCAETQSTQTIVLSGKADDLGGGTYRLDFAVSQFLPSGRYYLRSFSVEDKAMNVARLRQNDAAAACETGARYPSASAAALPIPVLDVENDRYADGQAPDLLRIKLRADHIHAGDPIALLFQATDDFAGIARYLGNGGVFECGAPDTDGNLFAISGPVRALADDWYEIEADTESDLATTDCWLKELVIADAAGNLTAARAQHVTDFTYEGLREPLAPLKVHVEATDHWNWQLFDLP